MIHQSLPDHFYYMFTGYSILGFFLIGRVWQVALMMRSSKVYSRLDSQFMRYATCLVGLALPVVAVTHFLVKYGAHRTYIGISQWYQVSHFEGVLMWIAVGIFVVTIPGMLYFLQWFYRHPYQRLEYRLS